MKITNKKGFTIVELVVVIAIIAILAAVLIPTFSSLIKRANVSKDNQLVRNLNTALAADAALNGKHETMYSALKAAEDAGYIVERINASAKDNEILWDSVNDVFCYRNGDNVEYIPEAPKAQDVDDYQYWIIASEPSTKYSTYLYKATTDTFGGLKTGLDVGNETVASITYVGNETAQNVVIRTNGGTLTINAENDEVTHYGQVDYVDIIAVKSSSYEERGTTSLIKVAKGNVALNSESKVGEIHFAKTGDLFTDIKVTLENGAKLPDLSRDPVGTSLTSDVLVCEVVTSGTSEYYWLSGNATIEDEKVLVSFDKEGTNKVAATAENSTAVAIANAKSGETVTDNGATVKAATEMSTEELVEATSAGAAKTFAEIGSKEELLAFRDAWNAGKLASGTFKLTANIDISGENWLPIGSFKYPFNGTIDGNNKTINGLTGDNSVATEFFTTDSTKVYGAAYGFIAVAGNGDVTVKDLTFTNVDINIKSVGNCVGTVIGYAPSTGDFGDKAEKVGAGNTASENVIIQGVSVSGTKFSVKDSAGAIIGKAYNSKGLAITGCATDITVESEGRAAGLVAYISGPTDINITGNTISGSVYAKATGVDEVALLGTGWGKYYVEKDNDYSNLTCYYNSTQTSGRAYTLSYEYEDNTVSSVSITFDSTKIGDGSYNAKIATFKEGCEVINNLNLPDASGIHTSGTQTYNNLVIKGFNTWENSDITINGATVSETLASGSGSLTLNGFVTVGSYVTVGGTLTVNGDITVSGKKSDNGANGSLYHNIGLSNGSTFNFDTAKYTIEEYSDATSANVDQANSDGKIILKIANNSSVTINETTYSTGSDEYKLFALSKVQ